jgi:hypothetical protein
VGFEKFSNYRCDGGLFLEISRRAGGWQTLIAVCKYDDKGRETESKEAFIIAALCIVCNAAPRERDTAKQVALPSHVGHFNLGETGEDSARTDGNPLDLGVHREGGERDRPSRHGFVVRFADDGLVAAPCDNVRRAAPTRAAYWIPVVGWYGTH